MEANRAGKTVTVTELELACGWRYEDGTVAPALGPACENALLLFVVVFPFERKLSVV